MKLLLDTHIWLWALERPEKLGKKVARAFADESTELWLSPVSLWETHLLIERGKVRLRGHRYARAWIEEALSKAPMREAPVTREVALLSRAVQLEHEDPADRFLAATAAVFDLTLVTADDRILSGKGFRTLANR
jgi:PIN domain nuclease of toxin-antitoxin system